VSGSDIAGTTQSYLEALNARGDFGRFFTDDVTIEIPGAAGIPKITGSDAVEKFIRDFHEQSFDANVSVRRVLVGDGGSAAELVFEGVHVGEFAGIAATQAHVRLPYCAGYDFTGGAISAIRVYLSVAGLVEQLGPRPDPGA
jgi:predicted ester cyclase